MQNTYWNHQGRFQAEYDHMVQELMPAAGAAETVAGELIRSVSRLGYDFYNNGMGNNTSGAVNYLRSQGAIGPETHSTIYEFTRGRIYQGSYGGDRLQVAIERAVDHTVEMILRNPALMTLPNTGDMFYYEDPDQHYEEEDEYELD